MNEASTLETEIFRSILEDVLVSPETGKSMFYAGGEFIGVDGGNAALPVEDGILRAFLDDDRGSNEIILSMQDFYSNHPFPEYEDDDDIGSLIELSVARGFPEHLNRSIPPNAKILEVGCGTGQLGNFLSIMGRRVLSVDATWGSLLRAQQFKVTHGLSRVAFAQMNLFRLPLREAAFDTVICSGVLHHTDDPYRGFLELVPLVRPGGYLIIGLYNKYGRLKTQLRRHMASVLGERVLQTDPYLKFHGVEAEKRRAWIKDQYKNPYESTHTIDEVLRWFEKGGLEFIRCVPDAEFGYTNSNDYRESLFEPRSSCGRIDRLAVQIQQMITDIEGGLFLMIGRRG